MNFTRPKLYGHSRYVVLFCVSVIAAALPFKIANAQDRALIVAIDEHADSRLADFPANLAANDAASIERVLTEKLGYEPEEIKILHNEEATRKAILSALTQWLYPEGAAPEGKKKTPVKKNRGQTYRSYFYFSGLGYFQPDRGGDEEDRMDEALVPYDATVIDGGGPSHIAGMISDDEIEQILNNYKRRHLTLVLDTSHSGLVTRSRNLATRFQWRMRIPNIGGVVRHITADGPLAAHKQEGPFVDAVEIPGGSLTVWSAASPTQTALIAGEDDSPKGLFTLLYAEGMETDIADANSNGIISNAELLSHIARSSRTYCTTFRERCEMGLRPRLDPPRAYGEAAWVNRSEVSYSKERQLSIERLLDFIEGQGKTPVKIIQSPMSPVHVGAKDIRYYVTSFTSSYVVLLNLTEDGELFQLYPNQYSGNGESTTARLIQANTALEVPDESHGVTLNATMPAKGHVIAIVTPDPVRFDNSVTDREISSVSRDEAIDFYLARLSAALHQPINGTSVEADTETARWSVQVLPYEILP